MAKTPPKARKPWTTGEVAQLRQEAKGNTPTRVIGFKHGRSEDAIRAKAQEARISLKPVNQSPYGSSKGRKSK